MNVSDLGTAQQDILRRMLVSQTKGYRNSTPNWSRMLASLVWRGLVAYQDEHRNTGVLTPAGCAVAVALKTGNYYARIAGEGCGWWIRSWEAYRGGNRCEAVRLQRKALQCRDYVAQLSAEER